MAGGRGDGLQMLPATAPMSRPVGNISLPALPDRLLVAWRCCRREYPPQQAAAFLSRRQQHSLFQVPRHVRVRGRVRIVRNHHDRLLEVLVQPLQNLQHFCCGMAVEVTGRFVRQQQRRIADNRARDGDALFLSAGELLGQVMNPVFQADEL